MKLRKGQRLPFKRRTMQKTDYKKRLALVKSGLPRLVARRTHHAIHLQLIEFKPTGDRTLLEIDSKALRKLGWSLHAASTPAAYLAGYMLGLRAKQKGISECVLDIGLQRSTAGSALYAAAKGVADADVSLPLSEDVVPDEKRLRGEHIAAYAASLEAKPEALKRQFGQSTDAQKAPQLFEAVKKKIEDEAGGQ